MGEKSSMSSVKSEKVRRKSSVKEESTSQRPSEDVILDKDALMIAAEGRKEPEKAV